MWLDSFDRVVDEHQTGGQGGTACVYALIAQSSGDPLYVGSTGCAEHRLYAHRRGTARASTPIGGAIRRLRAEGDGIGMVVLQRFATYIKQSAEVLLAERKWVEAFHLAGFELHNTALTPVGHTNSRDSPGKRLHAELHELRAENARLRKELTTLQNLTSLCIGCGKS